MSSELYTENDLEVIREAQELEIMLATPGWKRMYVHVEGLVASALLALEATDLSNKDKTWDALAEWQYKSDFRNQIDAYIRTIRVARENLAPRNELEALLLQEQLNGRNNGTDPAGPVG